MSKSSLDLVQSNRAPVYSNCAWHGFDEEKTFAMESPHEFSTQDLHQQLHTAIETRNTDTGKVIIDRLCQKISTQQQSDELSFYSHLEEYTLSPLLHAINKGNPDVSLYLLEKGCNPFSCIQNSDKLERPTLSKSIFRILEKPGFDPVVLHLMNLSENVVKGNNSETVLHVICKKKLKSLLRLVLCSLKHSHLLSVPDKEGHLPIHIAARHNFVEFFKFFKHIFHPHSSTPLLSDSGGHEEPTVDGSETKWEEGELHRECLMKSLHGRININARVGGKKLSALHIAAKERFPEIVELLLEGGADASACAEGSMTPLMECLNVRSGVIIDESVSNDIYKVCLLLIKVGASVNVYGSIPYSRRRSMANDDVVTPLHLAAGFGLCEVVLLLLNNGSDPTALSKDMGRIPLHFALERGHNECAFHLLSQPPYPHRFLASYADYAFNTLLHSADKCCRQIFTKLVNLRGPLDRPNVNNLRPLDKAITSGCVDSIQMLLRRQPHMVNVHLYQDPKATLPLYLAAISRQPLCQILLSHGADIYARAYGKHMAFRKAFRYNRYENGVYLCELMSRPFTTSERDELLSHEASMDEELARRLRRRLTCVPSLVDTCLDCVRQTVIKNRWSFKDLDSLPVPKSVLKALRYQGSLHRS